MMPSLLPRPLHGGFVVGLRDGATLAESAWLMAVEADNYIVPVRNELIEGKDVTFRDIDAAYRVSELARENGATGLSVDRARYVADSSPIDQAIADQLLCLAMGHKVSESEDPVGVIWKGRKHLVPLGYNELEGVADVSDFMREPEHEISVIDGEQYVYGTDWYFPHRTGEASWFMRDFKSVDKIIERPFFKNRRTSNISRMTLSKDLPQDLAESLLVHMRGHGSSLGHVSEVRMPRRAVILPRGIRLIDTAISKKNPTHPSGLLFVSSALYYIPMERIEGPDAAPVKETLRCDLLQVGDYWGRYDLSRRPYIEEQLGLTFDVSPDDCAAAAWAARNLYAVTKPYPVEVRERETSEPIKLKFRRLAEMHTIRDGRKDLVGVAYKVAGARWYVPLEAEGWWKKEGPAPDAAKTFKMDRINDIVDKIKGDIFALENICVSVGRPSDNVIETLKFALSYHYRNEIAAGQYKIG